MTFTPKFMEFCRNNRNRVNPFTLTGGIRPFSQQDADTFLQELAACTPTVDQLNFIHSFAINAKADFDKYVENSQHTISAAEQREIDAYNRFFIKLEKRLKRLADEQNSQTTGNAAQTKPNTSYKPAAATGQSMYDSVIASFGYDPTVVGASAMFYMLFASLKLLLGTSYWEQAAEYTDADPAKRFDPENITTEQTDKLLHAKSTPEEVLQAGYIPKPNLAHALDVEFKNFARKMGGDGMSQKQDGGISNLLRYNVNRPR